MLAMWIFGRVIQLCVLSIICYMSDPVAHVGVNISFHPAWYLLCVLQIHCRDEGVLSWQLEQKYTGDKLKEKLFMLEPYSEGIRWLCYAFGSMIWVHLSTLREESLQINTKFWVIIFVLWWNTGDKRWVSWFDENDVNHMLCSWKSPDLTRAENWHCYSSKSYSHLVFWWWWWRAVKHIGTNLSSIHSVKDLIRALDFYEAA